MLNSFVTFMTLLPTILPTWQESPMPKQFLNYDTEGYKSESQLTLKQVDALKLGDPIFKLNILSKLATLNSEDSTKILYQYLNSANDPLMRTATLRYLYECSVMDNQQKNIEKLISGQTDEGIAAARLYCKFPKANLNKVIKLLKNISPKDKITLAKALKDSQRISNKQWISIYKEDTSLAFKMIALEEIAKKPMADGALSFLSKIAKSSSSTEKSAVAANLNVTAANIQLLITLLNDKHATVRAQSALSAKGSSNKQVQQKLIALCKDKDSSVRNAAYESLSEVISDAAVKALFNGLGDSELLCQKTALSSLKSLSPKMNIEPIIKTGIQHKKIGLRRWTAHLLGFLNQKQHSQAILQQLKKEDDFDARTEQIFALGQFKQAIDDKLAEKLYIDHPRVRQAFMHYMGKLNKKSYYQLLHDAAMKDPQGPVRWAALEAMGNNGDPWFNKTILAIMSDLDKNNMRDYQDRAVACWAAGKIRSLDKKVIDKMILFMNRPTIPVIMGPNTYDNSHVLLSICFAFADQYHRGGEKKDFFFKYAKSFHFRFTKDRRSVDFPRSYQNDNYADQAWAYLNNESAPQVSLPARKMNWDFKATK